MSQTQFTTINPVQARKEQAEIEATPEYRFEQLLYTLETSLDALDRIAEQSDEREALRSAGLRSR